MTYFSRLLRNIRFAPLPWAREYPGDDLHLGHGVGKTSFCRLIRYSLGEAGFATKEFKDRVLYALPNAYVAAIVWIMGKQWVVARPLDGKKKKKFVVQDGDLFSVFSNKNQLEWKEYQQALTQAVLTGPLILPRSGNDISWGNILAWCARDQEAYLGDYYEWRSSKSGADSPGFTHPSLDPIDMTRLCLSGESANELRLSEKVKELAQMIQVLQGEVTSLESAPKLARERLARLLRDRIGAGLEVPVSSEHPELFPRDLLGLARQEQTNYQDRIASLVKQQDEVRNNQADEKAERKIAERDLKRLNSLLKQERKGFVKEHREREHQQQIDIKVLDPTDEPCDLGNVRLSDCQHIRQFRELIGSDLNEKRRRNESEKRYQERLEAIWNFKSRVHATEKTVNFHKERERQLEADYQKLQLRINTDSKLLAQLEQSIEDLSEYDDILSGRGNFTELNNLKSALQEHEQEYNRAHQSLQNASLSHLHTSRALTKVYKQIVNEVFPDSDAECSLGAETPFRISGRGGEAVRVSEVILGDICTLLHSAHSGVAHPGMLIHDSPREADMGDTLYQKYEQLLLQLQQLCISQDAYPFQYIVTTTTKPSPELLEQQLVKLELHSGSDDGLLYKQSFSGKELL